MMLISLFASPAQQNEQRRDWLVVFLFVQQAKF